jgi:hypothetical protein
VEARTAPRPTAPLDRMAAAFSDAVDRAGAIQRAYRVAGETVLLEFAGPALVGDILPSLEHLAPGASAPTLTVRLWDSSSTRIALPEMRWARPTRDPTATSPPMRSARQPDSGVTSFLDEERATAYFWAPDPQSLTIADRGTPLRFILHWWMAARGSQLVHGGAVGEEDGGVLLVGKGGAGKSTTALACVGSALRFAGDDNVLVRLTGGQFVAHALYNSAKLLHEDTHRFPAMFPAPRDGEVRSGDKTLTFVHRSNPSSVVREFPVRALLMPTIGYGPTSSIRPSGAAAALAALAPSTILSLPGSGPATLSALARIATGVPSYVLELGSDLRAVPHVIEHLLAEVGSR